MNHLTVSLSIAIFTGVLIFHGAAFSQTTPYPQQQRTKTGAPPTTVLSKTQSAPKAPRQTQPAPTTLGKTQTTKTETRTSQSQFHQAKTGHGHGYSHGGGGVGVGVGADIDLGGIGQRRPEADPFAVPAERQPVTARTEEKPAPAKKPREAAKTDPFANVQLTGPQAKTEKIQLTNAKAKDLEKTPFSQVELTGEEAKSVSPTTSASPAGGEEKR